MAQSNMPTTPFSDVGRMSIEDPSEFTPPLDKQGWDKDAAEYLIDDRKPVDMFIGEDLDTIARRIKYGDLSLIDGVDAISALLVRKELEAKIEELEGIKKETEYRMLNDLQVVGEMRTVDGLSSLTNKVTDDRINYLTEQLKKGDR